MASAPKKTPKRSTFKDYLLGVMAALFGVQSDTQRKKDFTEGSPFLFILIGVLAIALLVLALIGLSQLAVG